MSKFIFRLLCTFRWLHLLSLHEGPGAADATWDSKVSSEDMEEMWNHPDVNKEWSKSGEKRGKVRFSHDAEKRPYISRVELRVRLSNMDLQTICFVSSCVDYISTRWMLSLLLYSAVLDPFNIFFSVMVANPLHWVSISQLRVHNFSWPVDTERTSRQNSDIIWLVTLKYGRLLNILIKHCYLLICPALDK